MRSSIRARRLGQDRHHLFPPITQRRNFHDYFVTHLPSSSLHPDSRTSGGPHHKLPRSASKPHDPRSPGGPSPAPLLGPNRDTTVVRIPLRSAKHHFGASVSRGQRPYNEDTYQAGVIEIPAFAKRAPINLTRAPASSPLQAYREGQRKQQEQKDKTSRDEEGTSAESASGDPQVFYFGVFDGHGGTECSGFLKEKLHEYIEDAAQKYGLESSLGGKASKAGQLKKDTEPALPTGDQSDNESAAQGHDDSSTGPPPRASKDRAAPFPTQDPGTTTSRSTKEPSEQTPPSAPSAASSEDISTLQKKLMNSWRETVGGYFRRFKLGPCSRRFPNQRFRHRPLRCSPTQALKLLPSSQPHDKTSGIIPIPPRLRRKAHHRLCSFLRRPPFLDNIHNLLVAGLVRDAIAHQDHEGVFRRRELRELALRLRAHAHALGRHVPKRARVGQPGHAFLAKGVGDEGARVAPEAGRFRGRRWVMCGCQGHGKAIAGTREEDARVAAMGGKEGGRGGRVPEWSWGGGGDEGDGGGGAAFEGSAGGG